MSMTNPQSRFQDGTDKGEFCSRVASQRYFTALLGGLVANVVRMQEVHTVLDVECHEGGWVLDLAHQYPRIQVTGIDASEHTLNEATRFARFHGISNATFLHMDATTSLHFKKNTFDLVHMRTAQFLSVSQWASIIEELVRVLRPGGWLHLVDFEHGATSSIAFDHLMKLFTQTIRAVRQGVSLTASTTGTSAQLYGLLLDAYLLDVSYTVHAVDFNASNTLGAKAFLDEVLLAIRNVKAVVCCRNPIQPAEYDILVAQAYEDMMRSDACGYGFLISAVGCKDG